MIAKLVSVLAERCAQEALHSVEQNRTTEGKKGAVPCRAVRSSNTAQGRQGTPSPWRRSDYSPWAAGTAIHRASLVHTDAVNSALALAPARAHSPRRCAPVRAATAHARAERAPTPYAYFASLGPAPQPARGRAPLRVLELARAHAYTPLLPQGAAPPAPCGGTVARMFCGTLTSRTRHVHHRRWWRGRRRWSGWVEVVVVIDLIRVRHGRARVVGCRTW